MTTTRSTHLTEAIGKTGELSGSVVEHGQHALDRSRKARRKAATVSAAFLADVADEASLRAANVVAASKGARVRKHPRLPWIITGVAVSIAAVALASRVIADDTDTVSTQ